MIICDRKTPLGGNYKSNQNWACFIHYLKIINVEKQTKHSKAKQTVWGTQTFHLSLSRWSGSWVIDQIIIYSLLVWGVVYP